MNEVAKQEAAAPKPTVRAMKGPAGAMMPTTFEEAWRLSQALAHGAGEMIPDAYRGKEGAVFAAIQKGAELGFSPMASLSQIAVINGRASLWGDALPALVLRAGHQLDEWIEGEGKNMVAHARLTRGDTGQQVERTFSWADAEKAGLAGKKGPWQYYPKRMLQMRARGFAVRDGAADMMLGLGTVEEVMDNPQMRDVTPAAPEDRPRGSAAKMAALVGGPAPETDATPAETPQDGPEAPAGATAPDEGDSAASAPESAPDDAGDPDPAPGDTIQPDESDDAVAAARDRGREAFGMGMPLGAVPEEYRDAPALTKAWKAGWTDGEKAAKQK